MKNFLLISIIILLFPSTVLAASQEQAYVPANVNVFINGKQILFAEQPIIVDNTIMLPLREIAESLDVTVKWEKNRQVILKKNDQVIKMFLNSNRVSADSSYRFGKIFFMEQMPILINGHVMISHRFITTALGANLTWDEKYSTVDIMDNGGFTELPTGKSYSEAVRDHSEFDADKYYKLYDIISGPNGGPGYDEAKSYVLNQGLLNEVNDIQRTYIRFTELGDSVTMVSGIDKDHQEKIVWLSKNHYIGEISVSGSALKNSGLSKEMAISILQEKGINEASIIKLYIAPYEKDKIVWFVYAEQDDKQYYYCIDFFTGATFIENIFKNDVSF